MPRQCVAKHCYPSARPPSVDADLILSGRSRSGTSCTSRSPWLLHVLAIQRICMVSPRIPCGHQPSLQPTTGRAKRQGGHEQRTMCLRLQPLSSWLEDKNDLIPSRKSQPGTGCMWQHRMLLKPSSGMISRKCQADWHGASTMNVSCLVWF